MPYNGSGTFVLAQPAFVTLTPISSSAMNSDLSDIATGLSSVITTDGQSSITAPIKFANGSLGAPSISFISDTNTGIYRGGADLLAIGAGATLAATFSPTSTVITGTLQTAGQMIGGDGTVLLPQYSWGSDPDSGMYRIGANNIGIAVNAAKVLDISTTGLNVIGILSQNGTAVSPAAYSAGMINGTIVESHTGNAVTFALKTLAGTDPSATDPVVFSFRDTSVATGGYVLLSATAAMSIVVSSGSTLGFASGVAGKLWGVMFNDAGTLRMGVINCLSGTDIYPLSQLPVASSTAEGGSGGADSAQVFYTGTAVSSKAYIPLFYAAYETGLVTAGAWAASPTKMQLYAPYVPLPGTPIQRARLASGASVAFSVAIPFDNTIPQIGEGAEYLTKTNTPTSACHLREIDAIFVCAAANNVVITAGLFITGVNDSLAVGCVTEPTGGYVQTIPLKTAAIFNTTSSQTITLRAGGDSAVQVNMNGNAAGARYGGVSQSYLQIIEVVT